MKCTAPQGESQNLETSIASEYKLSSLGLGGGGGGMGLGSI